MRNSTSTQIISITQLRTNIRGILEDLEKTTEPFYIVSRSKPRAVLINVKVWEEKEEKIKDPFKELRKRHGDILAGVDTENFMRRQRV